MVPQQRGLSDQTRMEETRREDEEALKTYRELAQKEPETYLPEVAQTPTT
jgi:hypothetical protein